MSRLELNKKPGKRPEILEGHLDTRWTDNTIYNFFNEPKDFINTIHSDIKRNEYEQDVLDYVKDGKEKYKNISKYNTKYDKVYESIALEVRNKLIARGFTTKLLYETVGFTRKNTGRLSISQVRLGRPDCYIEKKGVSEGKLFYDFYINLSYSFDVSDETIMRNAYALYALTKELGRLISLRVIVVNHVGTDTPTCYSYIVKAFGRNINPEEFLYFISEVKRSYGWATYDMISPSIFGATVGEPENTVSIGSLNVDRLIDDVWKFYKERKKVL